QLPEAPEARADYKPRQSTPRMSHPADVADRRQFRPVWLRGDHCAANCERRHGGPATVRLPSGASARRDADSMRTGVRPLRRDGIADLGGGGAIKSSAPARITLHFTRRTVRVAGRPQARGARPAHSDATHSAGGAAAAARRLHAHRSARDCARRLQRRRQRQHCQRPARRSGDRRLTHLLREAHGAEERGRRGAAGRSARAARCGAVRRPFHARHRLPERDRDQHHGASHRRRQLGREGRRYLRRRHQGGVRHARPARHEPGSEAAALLAHLRVCDRDQQSARRHQPDATVLANGRVLWSRWDHAPGKDAMHLYSANPDGTDLELYYGANSHMTGTNNTGVEFVQPRQMQDGRTLALIRQYTGVDFGGNLVIIDGVHYAENTQPLAANSSLTGPAQTPATTNPVRTIPGPSPGGRFNSGYPLQDGTSRILVSWSQCRLIDNTQTPPAIVPCTSNALAQPNVQAAPPLYSVWMFDPVQNTLMPLMSPVEGIMVTDVAVAQPHPLPAVILDKVPGVDLDQNLV